MIGEKWIACRTTNHRGEFNLKYFSHFLPLRTYQEETTPYSLQKNGLVERRNRTTISMVQSVMNRKGHPHEL